MYRSDRETQPASVDILHENILRALRVRPGGVHGLDGEAIILVPDTAVVDVDVLAGHVET